MQPKFDRMDKTPVIADDLNINKICLIRGQQVMLDIDLAALYGVKTKVFNQAIKRNIRRFPEDFMFRLTEVEFKNLRSQFVTSSWGGRRYVPYAFTEQGVAMLSNVLNSDTAIEVNIRIIRIFIRMRKVLLTHKDILLKLEQMEKRIFKHDHHLKKHEEEIQMIFAALKQLLNPPSPQRKRIGFRTGMDND